MERENTFRLKMIKKKGQKADAEAALAASQ